MRLAPERLRPRTSSRRRPWRLVVEPLEERRLLTGSPPFSVGGDPIVNPADFRVTAFASGLNYPKGLMSLSDGSLLVAVNNPVAGSTSFYDSTGELLRFTDADGDGVADGSGQVLYNDLPGEITAIHQAGEFILATSAQSGSEGIYVLREGATPSAPLTLVGSLDLAFPTPWEHTTYASVVRPTPGQPGDFDVIFNVGSQYNGVVIGSNGSVVLDSNGNPTLEPTTGTVTASGLATGTLQGDSLYMVTLHDQGGTPTLSNLTQVATGLRNAASLAIDPTTGDLYLADNGIDGNDYGNEAWSADELDIIPAALIGKQVENFGFPYSYVKTIDAPGDPVTVVEPTYGIQPTIAFEPLPDPVLTAEGSESEGSSGFALSPPDFPAGLNHGVFIGFHGLFSQGGTANDENPMLFADPSTGHYFDFISNDLANIGHLDEALSTADSLFVADFTSGGDTGNGVGQGVIYQIKAYPQVAGPWFINGNQATQIQQNGASLTFTNEQGDSSPGSFLNSSQVVATGWGNLVGSLVPTADGIRIAWANGSNWDQLQLAGQGVIGNQGVQINQEGNSLTFINENGGTSPGYIADVNHVVATGWGNLVGTLTPTFEGFRISWANGTAWDMLRLAGPWFIGGIQPTQIVQTGNGNTLTFINENGGSSAGYIEDNSHVVATGWGNLVGTLVSTALGAQINWSNGSSWDELELGGQWFIGNDQPTAIYQGMNGLTLVNEHGQVSLGAVASADEIIATGWGDLVGTVVITSSGLQINWSNGSTWYQGGTTAAAIGVPSGGPLVAGRALVADLPPSRRGKWGT